MIYVIQFLSPIINQCGIKKLIIFDFLLTYTPTPRHTRLPPQNFFYDLPSNAYNSNVYGSVESALTYSAAPIVVLTVLEPMADSNIAKPL